MVTHRILLRGLIALAAGFTSVGLNSAPDEPQPTASISGQAVDLLDFWNATGAVVENHEQLASGSDEFGGADPVSAGEVTVTDEDLALRQQIYASAQANGRYIYTCVHNVSCLTPATPTPTTPAQPDTPTTPTITLHDLATYTPNDTTLTMEPAHWMLRDKPTNFIIHAHQHTLTAPLLGNTADVRFTPTSYTLDYGDDTPTHTTTTGGNTWTTLNLPEFSPTPTSHTYTHRGTYTITATTHYTAEYRLGNGPWTPVTGTLTTPTTLTARTITITTLHVRSTCTQHPTDPGCPHHTQPPDR